MKNIIRLGIIALLAAILTGCCACRSHQEKTRKPLTDTEWQLIQINGKTVQPQEDRFTLTLLSENHRVTGMGACNRLMGSYDEGEKRALKIGPLASTRMACPGMELEQEFARVLESTTHYDMDGPMLMLLSNGELRAVLQAKAEK